MKKPKKSKQKNLGNPILKAASKLQNKVIHDKRKLDEKKRIEKELKEEK